MITLYIFDFFLEVLKSISLEIFRRAGSPPSRYKAIHKETRSYVRMAISLLKVAETEPSVPKSLGTRGVMRFTPDCGKYTPPPPLGKSSQYYVAD